MDQSSLTNSFNDEGELVYIRVPREQRVSGQHLGEEAADGPNVHLWPIPASNNHFTIVMAAGTAWNHKLYDISFVTMKK